MSPRVIIPVDPKLVDTRISLNRGDVDLATALGYASKDFSFIKYRFHCVTVSAPHPVGVVRVYEDGGYGSKLLVQRDVPFEIKRWENFDLNLTFLRCPDRLNHRFQFLYDEHMDQHALDTKYGQDWGPTILVRAAIFPEGAA